MTAHPVGDAEFERLRAACDARDARLFIATLAPPEAVAASDLGTCTLPDRERQHIAETYREGYAARAFSNCLVDASTASADACAAEIARRAADTPEPGQPPRTAFRTALPRRLLLCIPGWRFRRHA